MKRHPWVGQIVELCELKRSKEHSPSPRQLALVEDINLRAEVATVLLLPRPLIGADDGLREVPLAQILAVVDLQLLDTARAFLDYSFRDINYSYQTLTTEERKFCSRLEFAELANWLQVSRVIR